MHDKIIKLFKKASFFSTNPDRDWRVMFSALLVLALLVFSWNFYFYSIVRDEIAASETAKSRGLNLVSNEQQDQLKKTLGIFDAKDARNKAITGGGYVLPASLSQDPSRF